MFKTLAVTVELETKQIIGHSTRIGAAQDLMDDGTSIGQIMAKVEWSKVDTFMRYTRVNNSEALNSPSTLQIKPATHNRTLNSIRI